MLNDVLFSASHVSSYCSSSLSSSPSSASSYSASSSVLSSSSWADFAGLVLNDDVYDTTFGAS